MNDVFNLEGKKAVITGSLGLLGPQWALALLSVGAEVILTGLDHDGDSKIDEIINLIKKEIKDSKLEYRQMDVLDEKQICQVFDNCTPDILINNAAKDPKVDALGNINSSRFETMSAEYWREGMSVALDGTFLCCKNFGNSLISQRKPGTIVNIASELSFLSPDQRLYENPDKKIYEQNVKPVTYMVAKAGVVALTKYLATYPSFLSNKIKVNSLSPSGVFNDHPSDFVSRLSYRIPLGRMAKIDEYRGALIFLSSSASDYMNGHNLILDGGKSLW